MNNVVIVEMAVTLVLRLLLSPLPFLLLLLLAFFLPHLLSPSSPLTWTVCPCGVRL